VAQLRRVAHWCRELGIKFKLNTVVNALNWREDMTQAVALLLEGVPGADENGAAAAHRKGDFARFDISDEQFEAFCNRHC
jgi:radical S-adenosyl methionine domain-containing protein 2